MTSGHTLGPLKQVVAASLTLCADDGCPFCADIHLLITRFDVPLEVGNAVAISYTWGEFDRRDAVIGHDENGNGITMNLGCEWDVADFINIMVSMSLDLSPDDSDRPMPFWIDQLCIPQNDEAVIRATLAAIPSIFYTFDAIALLPGSPCPCLRDNLLLYGKDHNPNLSHAEYSQLSMLWAQSMASCLNSISFCSYFERVWTRQEMLYTRKMRVQWTGTTVSPCVSFSVNDESAIFGLLSLREHEVNLTQFEEQALEAQGNLAPFALQIYQRGLATNITHNHALVKVKLNHDKAWHNSVLAFEDFMSTDIPRTLGRYFAIDAMCQFLLGMPLESLREDSRDAVMSEEQRIRKFAAHLSGVGWVQRSATRPRDYVVAVWVDCPRYVVPETYRSMSLPDLLHDAISQLERNFAMTVAVTAIAGLFETTTGSALWRPKLYLGQVDVQNTLQVYGTVVQEQPLLPITRSSALSLNVYSRANGRSKCMMPLLDFVRDKTASEVLQLIQAIVLRWPCSTMERIQRTRKLEFTDPVEGFLAGIRDMLLLSHPVMKEIMSESLSALPVEDIMTSAILSMISEDFNRFYSIVFRLVCDALGISLNLDDYQELLNLIVFVGEQPAIGIARQLRPEDGGPSTERIIICRDIGGPGSGHSLFGAIRARSVEERFPTYMLGTVWVPQAVTPWEHVSGTITDSEQNALTM